MMNESVAEFLKKHPFPTSKTLQLKWENSVYEDVVRAANLIHKNSLIGPANLVFVNSRKMYDKYIKEELQQTTKTAPVFSDAKALGILNNRYWVYETNAVDEEKIMVALQSNGFSFKGTTPSNGIPEIDIEIDPNHPKDTLKYHGFLELKIEER